MSKKSKSSEQKKHFKQKTENRNSIWEQKGSRIDKKLNTHRKKVRTRLLKEFGKQIGIAKYLESIRHHHKRESELQENFNKRLLKDFENYIPNVKKRHQVLETNLDSFIKEHRKVKEVRDKALTILTKPDDNKVELYLRDEGAAEREYESEIEVSDWNTIITAKCRLKNIDSYTRNIVRITRKLIYNYVPSEAIKLNVIPLIYASGYYWERTIDTCFEENVAEVGATVKVYVKQTAPSGEEMVFGPGINGHLKDIWLEGADRQIEHGHSHDGNNQHGLIDFAGDWEFGPVFLWPGRESTIEVNFEFLSHVRGEYSHANIDFMTLQPEEYVKIPCVRLLAEPV